VSLTRVVRIRSGIERDHEQNVATCYAYLPQENPPALDPESLFVRHYQECRNRWQNYGRQGVLVFAFDEQKQPLGELWLDAETIGARAGIIGRHSECDLIIPSSHISVSLRHLVVVVRKTPDEDVQFQVIDLSTGKGFCCEDTDAHRSVLSNGSMFVRMGTVHLMFLTTPVLFSGAETAKEAYHCLPERVVLEQESHTLSGLNPGRHPSSLVVPVDPEKTSIRSSVGPVLGAADLCGREEAPLGAISYRSGRNRVVRPVGAAALKRGILLGRYDRCHFGPSSDEQDSQVSRVHILLIRDAEETLVIDTASTNGTRINGEIKKFRVLKESDELDLGDGIKFLWNTAH